MARPTWSEARHLGRQASAGALAERAAPSDPSEPIPRAAQRWAAGVCVYCGAGSGLRVGALAITGKVYFCRNDARQFYADKKWEGIEAL
jgi:hypothetical protein